MVNNVIGYILGTSLQLTQGFGEILCVQCLLVKPAENEFRILCLLCLNGWTVGREILNFETGFY